MTNTNQIQIFQTSEGDIQLEVILDQETVWLTQSQLTDLFGRERSVITKHINNIFKEGELKRASVCANFAHTADDGKTYQTNRYNLDVIISVGYRVKSQRGVQFRQWATRVLKQYLVQGYSLNLKRLEDCGIEFDQALALLSKTLVNQQLVSETGETVIRVISDYARSWTLLKAYDDQDLPAKQQKQHLMRSLNLEDTLIAIASLKKELIAKKEASDLFVQIRGDRLQSTINQIEQSYGPQYGKPGCTSTLFCHQEPSLC